MVGLNGYDSEPEVVTLRPVGNIIVAIVLFWNTAGHAVLTSDLGVINLHSKRSDDNFLINAKSSGMFSSLLKE